VKNNFASALKVFDYCTVCMNAKKQIESSLFMSLVAKIASILFYWPAE